YMAPEQVEARPVDARTDVYALGLVLYEMLTGQRAWPGDAPFAVAAARLVQPPPHAGALRPDAPTALVDLGRRCLARDPATRIASATEVGTALAAIASTLAAPAPKSAPGPDEAPFGERAERTLAVLPLRNTGAPEDAWVADGLTEDLVDSLSATRGV